MLKSSWKNENGSSLVLQRRHLSLFCLCKNKKVDFFKSVRHTIVKFGVWLLYGKVFRQKARIFKSSLIKKALGPFSLINVPKHRNVNFFNHARETFSENVTLLGWHPSSCF